MLSKPRPTIAQLSERFGANSTSTRTLVVAANDNRRISPSAAPAPSLELIQQVMAALPNNYGYDDWASIAHNLRGASMGTPWEADVRDLFLDWSAQWGGDPDRNVRMWGSIHSPDTGWDQLLGRLHRENPSAYEDINQRWARETFAHLNGSIRDVLRPIPDWVATTNDRHATATPIKGVLDMQPPPGTDAAFSIMDYAHFKAENDNIKVDEGKDKKRGLGTAWLDHPQRRSYNSIGLWSPGHEPPGALNLFTGIPMPRGKPPAHAKCDLILDFFRDVVAGRRPYAFEYLMNWYAWKVQNPLRKPGTNLVFFGPQGTGKTTAGKLLLSIFGARHALHITSDKHLLDHFNGHMEGKLVVLADEALFGRNPAIVGRYKALTTEDTMTIEHKGLTARQVRNMMAFVMCSNSPAGVPVEAGDRRASVFRVEKQPGVHNDYFARLWQQWDDFGREAFIEHLLARDVSKFDPRVPLDTPEKLALASSTADSFTAYWLDLLNGNPDALLPNWQSTGGFIATSMLEGAYRDWCRGAQQRPLTGAELQERLDVLCPEAIRERQSKPPRARGRLFPSADRCLELAEQALGRPPTSTTSSA